MAFITTDEVKTLLKITDNSKDDLIDTLLPMVQDDISTYCNTTTFLNGMKPVSALMVNYLMSANENTGKQSETIGTYSYSSASAKNGYPDFIYSTLDKYKISSIKGGSIKTKTNDKRGVEIQSACCSF